jgi:hypothetical protein
MAKIKNAPIALQTPDREMGIILPLQRTVKQFYARRQGMAIGLLAFRATL